MRRIFLMIIAQVLFGWGLVKLYPKALPDSIGAFSSFELFSVIIIIILVVIAIIGNKRQAVGIQCFRTWKTFIHGLALLFPVSLIARVSYPGFDAIYAPQMGVGTIAGVIALLWVMPILVLKEELFERSLNQSVLSTHFGRIPAIIALSLNFAFFHLLFVSWSFDLIIFATIFLGSIVMALAYEKSKSILVTLLIHLIYNVLLVFQTFWHATGYVIQEYVFWIGYGIFFSFYAKKAITHLFPIFQERIRPSWSWLWLLGYALIPLGLRLF
ncbi:MAG: type II CAAX endopeptidase family protein [Nanoarchaeota archaeon]